MGLMPGMSLDLTENDVDGKPWDFNIEEKRDRAERLVKQKKALLLIGSPMCSAFSQIQGINFAKMTTQEVHKVIEYGTRHLEFCAKLYRIQHENGLYFLHEHPYGASSWKNLVIQDLLTTPGIIKVKSHMCAFGMKDRDHQGGELVKKPTGFMTNAVKLAERLAKDCSGDHRHVVLIGGGRARRAQVYPDELCKEIIIGLKDQMYNDGRLSSGMIGAADRVDDINVNLDPDWYKDSNSMMK